MVISTILYGGILVLLNIKYIKILYWRIWSIYKYLNKFLCEITKYFEILLCGIIYFDWPSSKKKYRVEQIYHWPLGNMKLFV